MELIPSVRLAAGLPPLVTPTSQIVGAQAVNCAMDEKAGESEVGFDLAACVDRRGLIVGLCGADRFVEQCVDLGGQFVGQRVERLRLGLLGAEYRLVQLLADST